VKRKSSSQPGVVNGPAEASEPTIISSEEAKRQSSQALFATLSSSPQGLSSAEAEARLAQYGPNALEEQKAHPFLKFLRYFWGPIPWMIEVAAVLSAVVRNWGDFGIIVFLLVFNAVIGFWEENEASNALEELKKELALTARVIRDGKWQEIAAKELVPGDVIRIRLGDVIPADVKLVEGQYLNIDQSALTGESLPVTKKENEIAFSGSIAKQGEMVALVTSTGGNTFFARTAKLVETAGAVSHFQKAVMRIGDFLIIIAVALSLILVVVELHRGLPPLDLIQFVLILVVASIPVAMPAVLSVTMALGALSLSKMKAIVSRLESIEEMAGIDVLCSDKTGTLTQNRLTLGEPVLFGTQDPQELILAGSLASRAENQDAIDAAVLAGLQDPDRLTACSLTKFIPFDPIRKRTEAIVKEGDTTFKVAKGAPQVILQLCIMDDATQDKVQEAVDELAAKGYRTLGVARTDTDDHWRFLGLLPLFDPPRLDAAATIAEAQAHGIEVKMITGDNEAIGREISRELGLGTNIQPATGLFPSEEECVSDLTAEMEAIIEKADGFAEVYPEHKYLIVKSLQERGHLVGMTGDGVNDAPALKQAEVGIAVSGATNAAQAAAALILTEPGLGVIIKAVEEARRIFERMMSYTIYRIAMTISIMIFVVAAMLAYNVFPLTAMMIIILALLDDIPIMTIAYDNTFLSPTPVRWEMPRVLTVSTVLGFMATIESFLLWWLGMTYLHLGLPELQTLIFLRLVAGGHLLLFITRTKASFWRRPFPSLPLFLAIICTQGVAVLMVGFGWLVPALPWYLIGWVWAYVFIWMFVKDWVKLALYAMIDYRTRHHKQFLETVKQPLHL